MWTRCCDGGEGHAAWRRRMTGGLSSPPSDPTRSAACRGTAFAVVSVPTTAPRGPTRPTMPTGRSRDGDVSETRGAGHDGPRGHTWRRGRHRAGRSGRGAGRGRGSRPWVGTQSGVLRRAPRAISSALGGMKQGTHNPWVAGSSPAGPIPPRGQFYAPAGERRRDGRTGSRADFAQGSARKCGVVERRPQSFPQVALRPWSTHR